MKCKLILRFCLLGLMALLGLLAACDGGGGNGGEGNSLPVAVDDAYATTVNAALSIGAPGVLRNDTDSDDDDLDIVLAIAPNHGTLNLDAETGAFLYRPDTNFSGIDAFIYWANDGTRDSNLATVTITVKAPPATYLGNTDQALIACENAVDIVRNVWETSSRQDVVEVVDEVIAQLFELYPDIPDQIMSDCEDGSSAAVQLQVDEDAGTFSGQIDFVDYCVNWGEGFALNGLVVFSGTAEETPASYEVALELEFDNVQKKENDGPVSYTITEGTATYVVVLGENEVTENITYNHVLREEGIPDKTYWFDDLRINIVAVSEEAPAEATFIGRFYDHDHGFVDVESEGPLTIADIDMPTGILSFYGKESRARLSFDDQGDTLLEVDRNNDGTIDCSTPDVFPEPL